MRCGTAGTTTSNLPPGSGDLVADPLFVDRAAGNYRLAAASPAIDAGRATTRRSRRTSTARRASRTARVRDRGRRHRGVRVLADLDADARPTGATRTTTGTVSPTPATARRATRGDEPPAEVEACCSRERRRDRRLGVQEVGTRFDLAGGGVAALREDGGFARAECRADGHGPPPWFDDRDGPAAATPVLPAARRERVRQRNMGLGAGRGAAGRGGLPVARGSRRPAAILPPAPCAPPGREASMCGIVGIAGPPGRTRALAAAAGWPRASRTGDRRRGRRGRDGCALAFRRLAMST